MQKDLCGSEDQSLILHLSVRDTKSFLTMRFICHLYSIYDYPADLWCLSLQASKIPPEVTSQGRKDANIVFKLH